MIYSKKSSALEIMKDMSDSFNEMTKEYNEVSSHLDNIENEIEELKQSGGGGGDIDLSDYVTKTELSTKADKTELHSHTNKTVLDGISSAKVTEWNNKSTFDGNYNSLTNKPTIPTKTSQLTNDSSFITSIPSEYVTETELDNKGYLTSHQDLSNYPKTSELTLGVHTDGLIYLFKGGQPVGNGVAQTVQSGDIVGYVDSNNNIVLSGVLADGTYNLKYEMEDGSLVEIGQLELLDEPKWINQIPLSINTDGSAFGTNGIKEKYRWSSSGGNSPASHGACTGLIPVTQGDIVYLYDVGLYNIKISTEPQRITLFNSNKAHVAYWQPYNSNAETVATDVVIDDEGQITSFKVVASGYIAISAFDADGASTAGVTHYLNSNSIITINKQVS